MALLVALLALVALGGVMAEPTQMEVTERSFTIDYDNNQFLKDGEPFRYVSGWLYPLLPRASLGLAGQTAEGTWSGQAMSQNTEHMTLPAFLTFHPSSKQPKRRTCLSSSVLGLFQMLRGIWVVCRTGCLIRTGICDSGAPTRGGILSPLLFNLLMEQLVALPFHDGTALLSYADDLALVVTGRGNKFRRTQQALDLISGKCEELGLKISAEKSRAMMVKAADPAWQLSVQGVELAWCGSYQYLGVWVDKRLSFTAHVAHLRERTQARLNVMRAMTRPTAGATFSVLRLYYVQAVRSLVDYSAPVLVALSSHQQKRLEVVQNTAMRAMLGAPRWSSACVMQSETGLVPLSIRVQQVVACRIARVLHRDAEGIAQRRLRLALVQEEELLRGNPWLLQLRQAAHSLVRMEGWPWSQADLPAPTFRAPPPWEPPAAEFSAAQLPASKAACTTAEV